MNPQPERHSGDDILDRYYAYLTPEEREIGRERLQQLTGLLVRIAMRQVREAQLQGAEESFMWIDEPHPG